MADKSKPMSVVSYADFVTQGRTIVELMHDVDKLGATGRTNTNAIASLADVLAKLAADSSRSHKALSDQLDLAMMDISYLRGQLAAVTAVSGMRAAVAAPDLITDTTEGGDATAIPVVMPVTAVTPVDVTPVAATPVAAVTPVTAVTPVDVTPVAATPVAATPVIATPVIAAAPVGAVAPVTAVTSVMTFADIVAAVTPVVAAAPVVAVAPAATPVVVTPAVADAVVATPAPVVGVAPVKLAVDAAIKTLPMLDIASISPKNADADANVKMVNVASTWIATIVAATAQCAPPSQGNAYSVGYPCLKPTNWHQHSRNWPDVDCKQSCLTRAPAAGKYSIRWIGQSGTGYAQPRVIIVTARCDSGKIVLLQSNTTVECVLNKDDIIWLSAGRGVDPALQIAGELSVRML